MLESGLLFITPAPTITMYWTQYNPEVHRSAMRIKGAWELNCMSGTVEGEELRSQQAEAEFADVEEGRLRGTIRDGVRCFLGVPFAAPPVGRLRFQAPRPASSWTGVRMATEVGAPSYQIDASNVASVSALIERRDPGVRGVIAVPPAFVSDTLLPTSSEDCLYLDIYAPLSSSEGGPLPVFLYYHGGANYANSAAGQHAFQSGENLARAENIIVVQPQYRLGALGWVHFGLDDDKLGEAVNLGLQDQIAALRWVARNIAVFGGDPQNITLAGESAGGTAVSHLITNPETRRYARRAILQSLSPFNTWCTQREPEARAVAQAYRDVLGSKTLPSINPDELVALQSVLLRLFHPDTTVAWRPHGAVVDGSLIQELPVLQLAEESTVGRDFQVMIGFAKDEWQFFRGHTATFQKTDRLGAVGVLSEVFGAKGAGEVYDAFAALYPDHQPAHLLSDIMSSVFFKFPSLDIARNLAAQGLDVYVFQFSYCHPGSGGYLRALHTGTIPFIFRNTLPHHLRAWRSLEDADLTEVDELAADFGSRYAQFIRSGTVDERWQLYDPDHETILWFGIPIESVPGLLQSEVEAFRKSGIARTSQLEERLVRNLRDRLPASLAALTSFERG
jgi:para-nitrobenzyl esterase